MTQKTLLRNAPGIAFFFVFLGVLIAFISRTFAPGLVTSSIGLLILLYWFYGLSKLLPAATPSSRRIWAIPVVLMACCAFALEVVFAAIGNQTEMVWSSLSIAFLCIPLIIYIFAMTIRSKRMTLQSNSNGQSGLKS